MEPDYARLVIDFDHEPFDEVATDYAVEVVAKPGRQPIEWKRERDRLRKPFQARQCPGGSLDQRPRQLSAARAADMDLTVKIQAKLLRPGEVDDCHFVASVKNKRKRARVIDSHLHYHVARDQFERY